MYNWNELYRLENAMKTKTLDDSLEYEVQASSFESALQTVYDKLTKEFGEHRTFAVNLLNVEITTSCFRAFTYHFQVTEL